MKNNENKKTKIFVKKKDQNYFVKKKTKITIEPIINYCNHILW
jgi:hypothetical protein